MTSRVLGLVREQVLAYWFGAGDSMDAFLVAFRVPNLVRDLFAEGAMSAALVPTFSRTLASDGRDRAWRLGNAVLNALVAVTGVVVVLAIVFAEPLVGLLAGGFAAVPGKFELTVQLTRVVMPFLVLVAVAAACMGMLNSLNVFFVPALSPAMFNIASIVAVVALVPVARAAGYDPILAVAVGALVGGLGQMLLQWPALRAQGFRYRPGLDLRDPGLRRVLLLMGPGTIGLAATQVNVFVNTVVATGEGTGAVSYLGYAFRVMYLPIGLFGVSIATATTPAMSRLAATEDTARMRSTLASAVALMLTLNVPATFGLVVLAEPIVRVLFERGSFTAADTVGTAAAVQLYALGLVGYSVVKIVSPTFYAIGRSRTPVAVGVAAVLLNAVLSVADGADLRLPRPGAERLDRGARQRRRAGVAGARRPRRAGIEPRGVDRREDPDGRGLMAGGRLVDPRRRRRPFCRGRRAAADRAPRRRDRRRASWCWRQRPTCCASANSRRCATR